ncbi:lysylphosphatidylglycerol synthase transmembrane domain-containing protein [Streptomyces sp. CA-106131]|uniref:lysylphosphatidylglycerol synthase transmembrane domain-containing protein n=1 Tax=Streptomyces sp. CA-106131 TaxID=3240045 RepID=UPI003D8A6E7C
MNIPDAEVSAEDRSAFTTIDALDEAPRRSRRWLRPAAVAALLALFTIELILGWSSLTAALSQLRAPRPLWFAVALIAELAAVNCYGRMQRRLLRSAGVSRPVHQHIALAYAAHSLSVTIPGGPAFSTHFNYQQMRRFGATPAVASWCIALSGMLSAAALAVITAASALASHGALLWRSLLTLTLAILLLTVGIRRITRHPEKVEPATRAALAKINRLRHHPDAEGLDRIRGFVEQLRATRLAPRHAVAAATYAVLNWVLDAGCLWLCFHAVSGSGVSNAQLLFAFCAGMTAGTVTIIPGGLGLIDSALILGLVTGGVTTSTAIATVVLYRIISFGFIVGAGWITWLIIRRHNRRVPAV